MMERKDVPEPAEKTITLPAEPSSAAVAREFVRRLLRRSRHRSLEDAALLCVTELVANVTRHTTSSTCVITLIDHPDDLQIEVADEMPEMPTVAPAAPEAEQGRGLVIVDKLAREWGVRRVPDDGKCIWLRLAIE